MKSSSGAKTLPTTSEWKVIRVLAAIGILTTVFCFVIAQGSFAFLQTRWWLAAAWVLLWVRFLWGSWQLIRDMTQPTSLFGWGITTVMALTLFGGIAASVLSAQLWWMTYLLLAVCYSLALVRYRHEEMRGAIGKRAFHGKRRLDWLGFIGIFFISCFAFVTPGLSTFWVWAFIALQFLGAVVIGVRTLEVKAGK